MNKRKKEQIGGKIILGGSVHVAGPNICERLKAGEEITIENDGREFYLKMSEAKKDGLVETSPWVSMVDADVKIETDAQDDEFSNFFSITFKDPRGQDFELSVSIDQARVMAEILSNYVKAFDAWEDLKKDRTAKANAI